MAADSPMTESIWMEDMKGMGMRGMHCGIPHMNVESNLTSGISGGEGRLSRKMVPVFCPMVCLLSCTNNSDHRNILIHAIVENCLTSSVLYLPVTTFVTNREWSPKSLSYMTRVESQKWG